MPKKRPYIIEFLKKSLVVFITFLFVFTPAFEIFSQETSNTGAGTASRAEIQQLINEGRFVGSEAQKQGLIESGYTFPAVTVTPTGQVKYTPPPQKTASGTQQQSAISTAAGALGTCSVGQMIGALVSNTIGTAISEIGGAVSGALGLDVNSFTSSKVQVQDTDVGGNTNKLTTKERGGGKGGGLLSGLLDISNVSLDSIGFCIANEMIHYIAQSTIQWINSGFEGNPVFVENPEQYFGNIADQEAAQFARQLVGQTTGIDVCQPFRVQLAVDTIGSHNRERGYGNRLTCTLDSIKNNYNQFVGGDWNSGGLPGWFELIQDQNNIYGARILANEQKRKAVEVQQNTMKVRLDWAKGYKSFTICEPEKEKRPDGSCPEKSTKTVTPGQYIEHNINKRSDSPQERLQVADEFDEIVSALVNQLIKIAINEVFEGSGNNNGNGN